MRKWIAPLLVFVLVAISAPTALAHQTPGKCHGKGHEIISPSYPGRISVEGFAVLILTWDLNEEEGIPALGPVRIKQQYGLVEYDGHPYGEVFYSADNDNKLACRAWLRETFREYSELEIWTVNHLIAEGLAHRVQPVQGGDG